MTFWDYFIDEGMLYMFEVGKVVITSYNNISVCLVKTENEVYFATYTFMKDQEVPDLIFRKSTNLICTDFYGRSLNTKSTSKTIVVKHPETEAHTKIVNLFIDWYYGNEFEKNRVKLEHDIFWATTLLKKREIKKEKTDTFIQTAATQGLQNSIFKNTMRVLQKEEDNNLVSFKIKSDVITRFEKFCNAQNKSTSVVIEAIIIDFLNNCELSKS